MAAVGRGSSLKAGLRTSTAEWSVRSAGFSLFFRSVMAAVGRVSSLKAGLRTAQSEFRPDTPTTPALKINR